MWSGDCLDGRAVGDGTLLDKAGNRTEGCFENGFKEGLWEHHWPDGYSEVGSYRKGKREEIWTITWSDGTEARLPYADGVIHGEAIVVDDDETVGTLIYWKGERLGPGLPPLPIFPWDDF